MCSLDPRERVSCQADLGRSLLAARGSWGSPSLKGFLCRGHGGLRGAEPTMRGAGEGGPLHTHPSPALPVVRRQARSQGPGATFPPAFGSPAASQGDVARAQALLRPGWTTSCCPVWASLLGLCLLCLPDTHSAQTFCCIGGRGRGAVRGGCGALTCLGLQTPHGTGAEAALPVVRALVVSGTLVALQTGC